MSISSMTQVLESLLKDILAHVNQLYVPGTQYHLATSRSPEVEFFGIYINGVFFRCEHSSTLPDLVDSYNVILYGKARSIEGTNHD
jgi:hypothetical protein